MRNNSFDKSSLRLAETLQQFCLKAHKVGLSQRLPGNHLTFCTDEAESIEQNIYMQQLSCYLCTLIFYIYIYIFIPFDGHISRGMQHSCESEFLSRGLKGILYVCVYVIDWAESGCGVVYSLPELRDRVIGHRTLIPVEASLPPLKYCL